MAKPINIDEITSIPKPIATSVLDQPQEVQSKQTKTDSVPALQSFSSNQAGQGAVAQTPAPMTPIASSNIDTQDVSVIPSLAESPNPKLEIPNILDVGKNIGTIYDNASNVKDNYINPLFGVSKDSKFQAQPGQGLNDVINSQVNIPTTGDNLYKPETNTIDTVSEEEAKKQASDLLKIKPEVVDNIVNKGDMSYFFSFIPNNLEKKSEYDKKDEEFKYEYNMIKELSNYMGGDSAIPTEYLDKKGHVGIDIEYFKEITSKFIAEDRNIQNQYQKDIVGLSKEEVAKKTKEYHIALLNNFKDTLKKSEERHGLLWTLPGLGGEVKDKITLADYRDFKKASEQNYHNLLMVREKDYKEQQGKAFIEKARQLKEEKVLGESKRVALDNSNKVRDGQLQKFEINTTSIIKNNSFFSNGNIEQRTNIVKKGSIYVGMYKKTIRPIWDAYNKTLFDYQKNKDNLTEKDKSRIEGDLIKEFNRINSMSNKLNTAYTAGLKADIEGGDPAYAINSILKGDNGIDTNLYGEKTIFNETAENAIVGNLGDIAYDINKSSHDGTLFNVYNSLNHYGNNASRGFSYVAHKLNKSINQGLQYGFTQAGYGYVGGGTNLSIAGLSEAVVDPAVNEDNGFFYDAYIKSIYRTSDQGQEVLGGLLALETGKGVGQALGKLGDVKTISNVYNKIKDTAKIENFVSSANKGNNTARLIFKSLGLVGKGIVETTKEVTIGEMFGGLIDQKMGTVSNDLDIRFNMAFGLIDLRQGFAPAYREFKLFKSVGVEQTNRILSSLGENVKPTDSLISGINDLLAQAKKDTDELERANQKVANRTAKLSFFKRMFFNGFIPVKDTTNVVDAVIAVMKGDLEKLPESVKFYVKGMVQNVANDDVTISKFIESVLMPKYVDGEGKTIIGSEPNIEFGKSVSIGGDLVSNKEVNAIERPKDVEKVGIKGDGSIYTEGEIIKIKDKADKLEKKGELKTDGLKKENIDSSFSKQEDGTYKVDNEKLGIKDNRTASQKVFDETIKNRAGNDFYKIMEDNGYTKEAQDFQKANTYETILKTMEDTLC